MSSTDFDDEARKLIAELSKSNSTDSFSPLDAIWQNKDTGAKVFIGNIEAARNKDILKENNVSCVVNCQDLSSPNFHEDDPSITYFRFPVAHWYKANLDTPGSTVAFFEPVFRFIDSKIAEGRGTTGVSYLMYKANLDRLSATMLAKSCRSIVNPIMSLITLLEKLEDDQKFQKTIKV